MTERGEPTAPLADAAAFCRVISSFTTGVVVITTIVTTHNRRAKAAQRAGIEQPVASRERRSYDP